MDEFTIDIGRGWRTRLCGRNRLVRGSDRLEAVVTSVVALLLMLSIPVAAAVSTAVHESLVTKHAQQTAMHQPITAVATADGVRTPKPFSASWTAQVQWRFGGETRTDTVISDGKISAGQDVGIWIDDHGARVPAPPGRSQAGLAAAWTGITLWLGTAAVGLGLLLLLRRALNRRRYSDWDRELDQLADDGGNHSKWR